MSQFVEAETFVTNPDDIIEAMIELGILREYIEVHKTPVPLSGYDRNNAHMAEIVVRKQHISARYGDLGATQYKDGKKQEYFRFISDDMDCRPEDMRNPPKDGLGRRRGSVDRKWGTTHGGFLRHLTGRAGVIRAEKELRKRGYRSRRVERRNDQGQFIGMNLVALER